MLRTTTVKLLLACAGMTVVMSFGAANAVADGCLTGALGTECESASECTDEVCEPWCEAGFDEPTVHECNDQCWCDCKCPI